MASGQPVPLNDLGRFQQSEITEILGVFESICRVGVFLNGSNVRNLESQISDNLRGMSTLSVSSGTDALAIALKALGTKPGDHIAVVGNAAGYSTNVVLREGATPIFVDVDHETSQMSLSALRVAFEDLNPIRAVIVTHLYGLMVPIDEISELCKHHKVLLIEDCAQAFGASHHGIPAGAWGDAAAFSFYPTKNLAALGDGGLVAFRKSEDAIRAKKIAQYGWSSRYEVELLGGINSRLDEIQAAVVLHRLTSVDAKNARRREILGRYARSVVAPRRFIFEDSSRCVAHLGVMRTPSRESDRARLRDAGIETSIHYPIPDHHQPAWRHLFEGVELPNTEAHCREVLTLPCFPELTEDEITRVCQALREL
jgi:dTDP-4-amino-4,6-dideoxygalactose transaminase